MSRLLTCGFEAGSLEEFNGGSQNATVQSTYVRTGDYALRLEGKTSVVTLSRIDHHFVANESEIFVRFALRIDPNEAQHDFALMTLYDSTHTEQLTFKYMAGTQTIDLYRGTDTLLAAGTVIIRSQVWTMVQIRAVIDDASGVGTVTVNNVTAMGFSGDTQATSEASVRSLRFSAYVGVDVPLGYIYIDDVAVNNTTGSYQASWAGLGGVYLLMPDAEGATQDWTPSTGTVHWSLVDEQPANTTDWVQALGTGNVELFEKEDTPEYIETINLVEVVYQAAIIDSGYNELEGLVRQDTTNYGGGTVTVVPIVPNYTLYKGDPHYVQPNGSGAWGTAEVNAAEVGFQIPG